MGRRYMPHNNGRFSISLTEKPLIEWFDEKLAKGDLSPSQVFRDALIQLKKEDDALHSENPKLLHERIDGLKKVIGKQSEFIATKDLQNEWFDFNGNQEPKPKKEIKEPVKKVEMVAA